MRIEQPGNSEALWARGADGRGFELRRLTDVVDQVAVSLRLPSVPAGAELASRLVKAEAQIYVEDGAGRWWVPLRQVEPILTRRLRRLPSSGPGYLQHSWELPELPERRGLYGARELLAWLAAGQPRAARPGGVSRESFAWLATLAISAADAAALFPEFGPAEPKEGAAAPVGTWAPERIATRHRELHADPKTSRQAMKLLLTEMGREYNDANRQAVLRAVDKFNVENNPPTLQSAWGGNATTVRCGKRVASRA